MTPASTNGTPPTDAVAKRSRLSVRELEASLPSPEEVAEQAAQLRAASVAAISVEDVNEMMTAVLKKAKEGDPKCTRLILDHLNSHKPERKPSAAPVPVKVLPPAEVEPPKPVAVAAPGVEQHRRLVAFVLLAHQPMSVAGLGQQCGLDGEQLEAVLNHEWFGVQNGQVRLTPAGRREVG